MGSTLGTTLPSFGIGSENGLTWHACTTTRTGSATQVGQSLPQQDAQNTHCSIRHSSRLYATNDHYRILGLLLLDLLISVNTSVSSVLQIQGRLAADPIKRLEYHLCIQRVTWYTWVDIIP